MPIIKNLADSMGIGAEFIGPKTVAEHLDVVAPQLGVFVGQEKSPGGGAHSEDVKIVGADQLAENLPGLRTATPGQGKPSFRRLATLPC